jgi:hypothetical protein
MKSKTDWDFACLGLDQANSMCCKWLSSFKAILSRNSGESKTGRFKRLKILSLSLVKSFEPNYIWYKVLEQYSWKDPWDWEVALFAFLGQWKDLILC